MMPSMAGNAEILRDLPPLAREKLFAALGGRQIRIPTKVSTLRKRVPELSEDEAAAVVGIAADAFVYFRRSDAIQARHSRVRVLFANGVTIPNIAAEVGLCETRVRQILKGF